MICKFCGKETNETSKFCTNCGADLKEVAENTAGENVEGTQTEQPSPEPAPVPMPEQTSTPEQNSDNGGYSSPILNGTSDYSNTSYQMPQPEMPYEQPVQKKKSSVGKIILIIVIIVLVIFIALGAVFGYIYITAKKATDVLTGTWTNISNADTAAIMEELPDEFIDEMSATYGFSESDVEDSIDFMLADLADSQFTSGEVTISDINVDFVKSSESADYLPTVINSIFEDTLADYESEFSTVFAGTYAVVGDADKCYLVDETLSDSSGEEADYTTILLTKDKKYYDATALIVADICCYYYDVYTEYMSSYDYSDFDTDSEVE